MFKDSRAFSGFSSNETPGSKAFYAETLGLAWRVAIRAMTRKLID